MKCLNEKTYILFLDNELNPEDREKVIPHLKKCIKCSQIVERLKLENLKIKKSFEIEYEMHDLVPKVMERILLDESFRPENKKLCRYTIYGLFIITGIFAPYFILKFIKPTFIFQNILVYIFTPLPFLFSSISFLLRKIFLSDYDLNRIIIVQIFLITFLFVNLINYLIKKFKIKEETK